MKRSINISISLLLTFVLTLGLSTPAQALTDKQLSAAVKQSAEFMLNAVKTPQVGSIGGEWAVIGLARSGYRVPQEYWDDYYTTVEQYVEACGGVLHKRKYTEYSRVTVALTAIGADPTDVAGYNLLLPLADFDKTIWQGINGPIWALMAFDSGNYDIPLNPDAQTQATRQMYIDEILKRQNSDGGWSLTSMGGDNPSDPDITGMALQALAKYQYQAAVKQASDKALDCLSALQDQNGGFESWGTSNSESVVQVLVALCELGLDINDPRFVKNGNSLLDNLMTYRNPDGSFRHTQEGSGSNQMAAEQGFYGIVAAMRAAEGKNSLYRMSDCTISVSANNRTDTVGLPGRHSDVQKTTIVAPGKTFGDISAHNNQPAIEALIARGIVDGMGDDTFSPDEYMTRAQFAAIVVRALGLTPKTVDCFEDVYRDEWYAPYIGTAYSYGIVNGRSAETFDPNGAVTRQEAAAMLARAAKLCGMDAELENYEILNSLAQFGDYITVSDWAKESMAFCYSEDILDQSDLNIRPNRAVKRCEMAQMIYNLLGKAKLL